MQPGFALHLTLWLVLCRCILNAAEVLGSSFAYSDRGIFSWTARRSQRAWTREGLPAPALDLVLGGRGYLVLCGLQLIIAATLLCQAQPLLSLLWLLLGIEVLSDLRNSAFGRDGSDRMHLIVLVAVVGTYSFSDPAARSIGLLFLAILAMIAYFTSGAVKLLSPGWRDGLAMPTVLASENYGVPALGRWLDGKTALNRALCWSVIAFELSFAPIILLGAKAAAVLLAMALCFHVGIAATMGLNSFVWSFSATYPALYLCAGSWPQLVSGHFWSWQGSGLFLR